MNSDLSSEIVYNGLVLFAGLNAGAGGFFIAERILGQKVAWGSPCPTNLVDVCGIYPFGLAFFLGFLAASSVLYLGLNAKSQIQGGVANE